MMAVGVARPSAQGHEMTRTLIAEESAKENPAPVTIQKAAEASAIRITTGTKYPLIRSARREMGALEDEASSTSAIIRASVVSFPLFQPGR